jgi:hypothetical protein
MAPTNFDQAVQTLTHHISIIKSPYNVSRPTQQTLALSLNTHVAPSPNPNKYPPPPSLSQQQHDTQVRLQEFPATVEGVVQSFVARFPALDEARDSSVPCMHTR